jgi:hypothetical protein
MITRYPTIVACALQFGDFGREQQPPTSKKLSKMKAHLGFFIIFLAAATAKGGVTTGPGFRAVG